MSNSKKNIVFDLKKNFQEKNSLINRLKDQQEKLIINENLKIGKEIRISIFSLGSNV